MFRIKIQENYSSMPWLTFFEKTITIEVEKSNTNTVIINDISITFQV